MSIVHNIFCPECDSILDISKTVVKKQKNESSETPSDEKQISTLDNSINTYYTCKSCSWFQKIKSGTLLLNKIGNSNQTTYYNLDKYKNKVYSNILPYTRNYVCSNKECIGNTDLKKHEALIFRINGTMETMLICCACESIIGV